MKNAGAGTFWCRPPVFLLPNHAHRHNDPRASGGRRKSPPTRKLFWEVVVARLQETMDTGKGNAREKEKEPIKAKLEIGGADVYSSLVSHGK